MSAGRSTAAGRNRGDSAEPIIHRRASVVQVSSRIVCGAAVVVGLMTTLLGAQATNSSAVLVLPSDRDIRQVLVERVDAQGKGVGIVVGVIGPGGRRVISHGQLSEDDP